MNIGENIKKYRMKLGLTQEAIANKVGVTAQAVSKWETGECIPDGMLFIPIADVLGISLDRLCGHAAVYEDDVYNTVARLIRKMPREEQMNKIREICWQTECALFDEYSNKEAAYTLYEMQPNTSSFISNDYGFTFISNKPELPFYAVFPRPENGYGAALDFDEVYHGIMEALADEYTLKSVLFLYGKSKTYTFEAAVLAGECGIPDGRIDRTVEMLLRIQVIEKHDIIINNAPRVLYSVRQRHEWVAILSLIHDTVYHNGRYIIQADFRSKPYA